VSHCTCGHLEYLHAIGKRAGRSVRTYCNSASPQVCACKEFSPAQPVPPKTCYACGAQLKAVV
jgi:hypothetical protein